MKIWIHIDGVQHGPYDEKELAEIGIDGDTPVWYPGLEHWMKASEAPVTAAILNNSSHAANGISVTEADPLQRIPLPTPPTYLVWSILATLCCCTPFGIVAIFTGAQTRSRYKRGDMAGAFRSSHATEWWLIIAFVLGLVMLPLTMAIQYLGMI